MNGGETSGWKISNVPECFCQIYSTVRTSGIVFILCPYIHAGAQVNMRVYICIYIWKYFIFVYTYMGLKEGRRGWRLIDDKGDEPSHFCYPPCVYWGVEKGEEGGNLT